MKPNSKVVGKVQKPAEKALAAKPKPRRPHGFKPGSELSSAVK